MKDYRDRMRLIASGSTHSPIEALLFGALSEGSGFVICHTKPDLSWFSGHSVALVPQYRVDPHRVDMAIFVRSPALYPWDDIRGVCVECDGHKWHGSAQQIEADSIRDRAIYRKYKMPVWRYAGTDIHNNLAEVADEIEAAVRDFETGYPYELPLARMVNGLIKPERAA